MIPRFLLPALLACFMVPAATSGQTVARTSRTSFAPLAGPNAAMEAVSALRRLRSQVIVYHSQQQFDDSGRLANVDLADFENELAEVTAELLPALDAMPAGRVKTNLMNSLFSYRDGLHWWKKVDRPRVVHVSMLAPEAELSAADRALAASAGYTVAIHWRQAARFLERAEVLIQSGSEARP